MKLMIDPGHGGRSTGAVANGLVEKKLVLDIAGALRRSAHAAFVVPGHMTRIMDVAVSLDERGRLSREFNADLVLSIHANAWLPSARGLMAFYWPGNEVGRQVAQCIQRSAPLGLSQRSARPPYAAGPEWPRVRNVLRRHRATAVLVELGFLTNVQDAQLLASPQIRQELLPCLLSGVARAITLTSDR